MLITPGDSVDLRESRNPVDSVDLRDSRNFGDSVDSRDSINASTRTAFQIQSRNRWIEPKKRKMKNVDGHIIWYDNSGQNALDVPVRVAPRTKIDVGTLYIHRIDSSNTSQMHVLQIWIWSEGSDGVSGWQTVTNLKEQRHPILDYLSLSFTPTGEPSWLKATTARRQRDLPVLWTEIWDD